MSRDLQSLLKAKISENLKAHSQADKSFSEFDIYKTGKLTQIPLTQIKPNQAQPRKLFDENALAALADSIDELGLLQPIIVRANDEQYQIVAGERRYRATQQLGKTHIDAIIINTTDENNVLLALAENLGRADLTDYEVAQSVLQFKQDFPSKTEYAKALGLSRQKLYKLFAYESLPPIVLDRLNQQPDLLSADTAEQLVAFGKQQALSGEIYSEALSTGLALLAQGNLKQANLIQFLRQQLQKQNEKCPNSDTLAVSANKRLYHREGKVIGKLQQTAKKIVIELDNQALTEQQQQQLEQFLGELLG
jgi:ParB family chromosome partitioning protein